MPSLSRAKSGRFSLTPIGALDEYWDAVHTEDHAQTRWLWFLAVHGKAGIGAFEAG